MDSLQELEQTLGWTFRDPGLLQLALTHPSATHDHTEVTQDNQRLEFLGDAVLQLILTRELYERFPELGEGVLTQIRARLVNRRYLAEQGRQLQLGKHLRLSRGEELHGGRERPSALADVFEAVLGALLLDAGYDRARDFVLRCCRTELASTRPTETVDNPKGQLQELLQATSASAPKYQLEQTSGPDHDRLFQCAVYHEGRPLGRGAGKSKKEAESEAARSALEALRTHDASPPTPTSAPNPLDPGDGDHVPRHRSAHP